MEWEASSFPYSSRRLRRTLFARIGFRDNQAHRVLIESLEPAFALQILK
jgi:hypothetical protein